MIESVLSRLEERLGGRLYAKQRLGIETDHEAQIFGQGLTFFHIENWYSIHSVIRTLFKVTGLYWRGKANAARVRVRRNDIYCKKLPPPFHGFTLLHMTDFHADMNDGAMRELEAILPGLRYDLCVLTGDYRGATFGNFDDALARMRPILACIKGPVYGVLGNHDTIRMVPDLEAMGIRMLLNELSHTPEIYRQAAHAGFDLLLSGHTHGGQICLPGSIPLTLGSVLPRRFGAGAWQYHDMAGYTSTGVGSSIVPVRINCFPEITLHCLWRVESDGLSVRPVAQSQPEKQPRE
jgi:predicted MPP superfamily phosphohydrolase